MTVQDYVRATFALLMLPFVLIEVALCVTLILFVPACRADRWVQHTNLIIPNWQRLWKGAPRPCIHHTHEPELRLPTRATAAPRSAGRPASSARSTGPRTRSSGRGRPRTGARRSRTS